MGSLYWSPVKAFLSPGYRQIAVKVINDYGDEVMKVFSV